MRRRERFKLVCEGVGWPCMVSYAWDLEGFRKDLVVGDSPSKIGLCFFFVLSGCVWKKKFGQCFPSLLYTLGSVYIIQEKQNPKQTHSLFKKLNLNQNLKIDKYYYLDDLFKLKIMR
jgi:hypothetical protein